MVKKERDRNEGGLKREWENFQDEQDLHPGCEMEEERCVFDSEEGWHWLVDLTDPV